MPDLELKCVQCHETFLFNEKDQEMFYRRNLPQPQRCAKCRPSRKKAAQAAASGESSARTRYEIVCDKCGKQDYVPFAPKAGRAVLCSDCHNASRARVRFA